ncbi:unnamed protein product [Caenorhabditis bovis]|uniref:Histone deacetylase interacting domain-containing protein n=1 Tax=Caenorhabditis bovis TaxID=2654633 RepID=A0A8S1FB91_9PELO|nr:unnamed protein product [Caenorhabditis bovis]
MPEDSAKVRNALSYLETVKAEFRHDNHTYEEFLRVMKDFRSQALDTPGVIQRVSALFHDHPELILNFNTFLPAGFQVTYIGNRLCIVNPKNEYEEVPPPDPPFMNGHAHAVNGNYPYVDPEPDPDANGEGEVEGEHEPEVEHEGEQDVIEEYEDQPRYEEEEEDEDHQMIEDEENEEVEDEDEDEEVEEEEEGEEGDGENQEDEGQYDENGDVIMDTDYDDMDSDICPDELFTEQFAEYFKDVFDDDDVDDDDEEEDNDDENLNSSEKKLIHRSNALSFTYKIKKRFESNPKVYRDFLDILQFFIETPDEPVGKRRPECKLVAEAGMEVKKMFILEVARKLFAGHDDLLKEFERFIPKIEHFNQTKQAMLNMHLFETEPLPDELLKRKKDDIYKIDNDDETADGDADAGDEDSRPKKKKRIRDEAEFGRREIAKILARNMFEDGRFPLSEPERGPTMDMYALLSSVDMELYSKLQQRFSRMEFDRFFILLNVFLPGHISIDEFLDNLKNMLGSRHHDIVNEIFSLFGEKFDYADESDLDDESDVKSGVRKGWIREGENIVRDVIKKTICTLGVSYRHIIKDKNELKKPSGRTALCDEVLNDTWTSYPSWSSEDNGNVASRKSTFEEFLYKTEDERFELDIVLDVNKYAIESFELLKRKMERMSEYDRCRFKLDEKLGCSSGVLITRAIKRIYGEAASKIIHGLRDSPFNAVPKVLQRFIEKEKEWRQAQTQMNKMWREQLEKNIARSLDHQAATVKQADSRLLKTKSLVHSFEAYFDQRQGDCPGKYSKGPHMKLCYPERKSILHDVNDLLVHYLRRQQHYTKDEKRKMKIILRKIVLEWMCERTEEMSDDEEEEELELEKRKNRRDSDVDKIEFDKRGRRINLMTHYVDNDSSEWPEYECEDQYEEDEYLFQKRGSQRRLIYGDDNLFVFMRLHHALCERLHKIHSAYLRGVEDYYEQERCRQEWERDMEQLARGTLLHAEKNWGALGSAMRKIRNVGPLPTTLYKLVLTEIKRYMDGEMDASQYEDCLRSLFPTQACHLFLIDKIMSVAVRSLATLANNEDECSAIKMYMRFRFKNLPNCFTQSDFVDRVEKEYAAMAEERLYKRNCYKLEYANHTIPILTVTMIDTNLTANDIEQKLRTYNDDANETGETEEMPTVDVPDSPRGTEDTTCTAETMRTAATTETIESSKTAGSESSKSADSSAIRDDAVENERANSEENDEDNADRSDGGNSEENNERASVDMDHEPKRELDDDEERVQTREQSKEIEPKEESGKPEEEMGSNDGDGEDPKREVETPRSRTDEDDEDEQREEDKKEEEDRDDDEKSRESESDQDRDHDDEDREERETDDRYEDDMDVTIADDGERPSTSESSPQPIEDSPSSSSRKRNQMGSRSRDTTDSPEPKRRCAATVGATVSVNRRTFHRTQHPGFGRQLFLKRTAKKTEPKPLRVLPIRNFKTYNHVPRSSEIGGFVTMKGPFEEKYMMLQDMHFIRLERSKYVQFENRCGEKSDGEFLERLAIKEEVRHPVYHFLKYNIYRCETTEHGD